MRLSAGNFKVGEFPSTFKTLIITGKCEVFKNALLDAIYKNKSFTKYDITNYKNDLDKIKYKPILSDYWWVRIQQERLSTGQLKNVLDYIQKPSSMAFVVINSSDNKFRRSLIKNNVILKSSECAWVDLEYPGYSFLRNYIERELAPVRIDRKALSIIPKLLADNYDEYPHYIKVLRDLPTDSITADDVKNNVDDLSQYKTDELISTIVNLDKKTVPFKALHDILDEYNPTYVLASLKSYFRYLYDAKIYLSKGLLIDNGNIERDKEYIKRKHLLIPDTKKHKPLINLPHKYINKYLTASKELSMREILYCMQLVSSYKYTDEKGIYKILILLLNRRNTADTKSVLERNL